MPDLVILAGTLSLSLFLSLSTSRRCKQHPGLLKVGLESVIQLPSSRETWGICAPAREEEKLYLDHFHLSLEQGVAIQAFLLLSTGTLGPERMPVSCRQMCKLGELAGGTSLSGCAGWNPSQTL